jgi:cation diffusion facilitator CzcD-associated flavoprotein CzcO
MTPPRPKPKVVIIGAGISGILMGIKLRARGLTDFVILEKGETLGGTWRDNRYPGVACDVAAHLYVYSFAPNPAWRSRYAKGPDIWKYYHDVARRYGVLPHIRYGQQVASAQWQQDKWLVSAQSGESYLADIVVSASGRLHHPVLPDIAGTDSFAGPSFHTSRWDESLDIRGLRLGVIGTGSTATQIVASSASKVRQLKLFQRTAQWVYPLPDTPVLWWKRLLFRLSPARATQYYYTLRSQTEERGKAATGDPAARAARDQVCFDALASVREPELRRKLTPDYEVGCKRLVFSGDYYEAVQQPSVDVVTQAIDHIEPRGVVTSDGTLHELDILAFATGFDAHAYLRPMQLTGEDGITLDQVWAELPASYRSMAIPQMPNFLMLNGPYSPGGTASVVGIVEAQAAYVMQLIERIVEGGVAIAPKAQASRAWLDSVRARARDSVWATGGCQSWYLDKTGTPTLDPSTLSELEVQLAEVNWDDFEVRPIATRPAKAA